MGLSQDIPHVQSGCIHEKRAKTHPTPKVPATLYTLPQNLHTFSADGDWSNFDNAGRPLPNRFWLMLYRLLLKKTAHSDPRIPQSLNEVGVLKSDVSQTSGVGSEEGFKHGRELPNTILRLFQTPSSIKSSGRLRLNVVTRYLVINVGFYKAT